MFVGTRLLATEFLGPHAVRLATNMASGHGSHMSSQTSALSVRLMAVADSSPVRDVCLSSHTLIFPSPGDGEKLIFHQSSGGIGAHLDIEQP